MTKRACLALLLLAASWAAAAETVAWRNGLWFDGAGFVAGTLHSVDGVFVAGVPATIDRTVELGGRHVVPAYGDAHHHGIDSAEAIDDKILVFLEAGIYYVKNPNAIAELVAPVRGKLGRAETIDVTFAHGGLTSPGGHPAPIHDYMARAGVFPGLGPADMEDRAYFAIDTEDELERKWPRIAGGRADFVKVFLLFAGEHAKRRQEPSSPRGLDPELLRAVVRRARAAALRVSAHVDTADDFRRAVEAGVDEINHLPQPDPRYSADLAAYVIDAQTARRAAGKGITVVTTASTTERLSGSALPPEWVPAMRSNQAANLATLRAAGVKIAIGSDGISGERRFATGRDEVRFLARQGMLDNLALLRAFAVHAPQTIVPHRKVGELRAGFEANFLVLAGDPLADAENLHRIAMRVKAGRVLPAMPAIVLGR